MSTSRWVSLALLCASAAIAADAAAAAPAIERARETVARLENEAMAMQAQLRGARANRDFERVRCVDDALTRLHVAARAGRALRDVITSATVSGDARSVEINTVRLDHLGQRTQRLFQSAQRCGDEGRTFGSHLGTSVTAVAPAGPPGVVDYPAAPRPK